MIIPPHSRKMAGHKNITNLKYFIIKYLQKNKTVFKAKKDIKQNSIHMHLIYIGTKREKRLDDDHESHYPTAFCIVCMNHWM